jgi:uncharacterized protein (DUF924 family)
VIWFQGTAAFDGQIRHRFGAAIARALEGRLDHLAATPRGALALCLLLDQMTRNAFRGSAGAFAGDRRARRIAGAALRRGFDRRLATVERLFLYMPFHHSESRGDQGLGIGLMSRMCRPSDVKHAIGHRDIVARFGRFPHRNAVLARPDTPAETAYLSAAHPRFGQ